MIRSVNVKPDGLMSASEEEDINIIEEETFTTSELLDGNDQVRYYDDL